MSDLKKPKPVKKPKLRLGKIKRATTTNALLEKLRQRRLKKKAK